MMKNANMPAMPVLEENNTSAGLTKREMFAMHAMQGVLSGNSLESLGKLAKENGLEDAADALKVMACVAADAVLSQLDGE